jgi:hypothetical protein
MARCGPMGRRAAFRRIVDQIESKGPVARSSVTRVPAQCPRDRGAGRA